MKDDVTKVEISKTDISGKELPGAKLTILDKDGKTVESLSLIHILGVAQRRSETGGRKYWRN